MAVLKVKLAGQDVTFQSEDDFARALAALGRVGDSPEKNGKATKSASTSFDAMKGALAFLHELVAHPGGMHSNVVSNALECEPRGIGRRLLEVDTVLKPLGFKRDRVYNNDKRLAEGGRVYFPGPDAVAAFEAVKRKAGGG